MNILQLVFVALLWVDDAEEMRKIGRDVGTGY